MNDFETVNRLVNENIKLAYFFANKYAWKVGENEALSFSLEGLHLAAQSFDESRGIPFGSYASQQINWRFSRDWQHNSRQKRGGGAVHASLDAPLGEDGNASLGDLIADTSTQDAASASGENDEHQRIRGLLNLLNDRDRQILTMRFGLDGGKNKTLDDIGKQFNLTRERIRQIEAAALDKMAKLQNRIPVNPKPIPVPRYEKESAMARRRAYQARYRAKNRLRLRRYFRQYRAQHYEELRAYSLRNRARTKKWRRAWYIVNRPKIRKMMAEKYAANPEPAKLRARIWRTENRERFLANKVQYREANREYLRQMAAKDVEFCSDYYIRNQLHRRAGRARPQASFTAEEIESYRQHVLKKRQKLDIPCCPHCGKKGRKDGFFRPSGNRRYSCLPCKKTFGIPAAVKQEVAA